MTGLLNGHQLGVSKGVGVLFPSVVTSTDDLTVGDEQRTHRHFSLEGGFMGKLKGLAHEFWVLARLA